MPVQGVGVDTQPLPSESHLDNRAWMELTTRDLWNLDNDQLREMLEAVQFKTAKREGATPMYSSAWGSLWVPWGSGERDMDDREEPFKGRGGDIARPCRGPQVPLD